MGYNCSFLRKPKTTRSKVGKCVPLLFFQEKWELLRKGFHKLLDTVEGGFKRAFENDEYMKLYATVYDLCTQSRLDLGTENVTQATAKLYHRFAFGLIFAQVILRAWIFFQSYMRGLQVRRITSGVPH